MNTAIAKPPIVNARYLLLGLVMLLAAGLSVALTPRMKAADQGPKINLETMIPKQFGEWRVDESIAPLQVSPDVQAKLDKIYNQTLSRTYVNGKGERIMLSIAYGSDQSDTMSVHKPEVCYPAQGFEVLQKQKGILQVAGANMPVVRLVARQKNRIEPITYWITVGNQMVTGGLDRKLAQMRYGLTGTVPDGMLFRVSSIEPDVSRAYASHERFIGELHASLDETRRAVLYGRQQTNGF